MGYTLYTGWRTIDKIGRKDSCAPYSTSYCTVYSVHTYIRTISQVILTSTAHSVQWRSKLPRRIRCWPRMICSRRLLRVATLHFERAGQWGCRTGQYPSIPRSILSSSSIGVGTKYIVIMYSSEPCMRQIWCLPIFSEVNGKSEWTLLSVRRSYHTNICIIITIRRRDQTLTHSPVRRIWRQTILQPFVASLQ